MKAEICEAWCPACGHGTPAAEENYSEVPAIASVLDVSFFSTMESLLATSFASAMVFLCKMNRSLLVVLE